MKFMAKKTITLSNGKSMEEPRSYALVVLIIFLIATAISVEMTGFKLSVLINRGDEFFLYLRNMLPPDVSYLSKIWNPLFDTIKMSLLGSALGSLLAIPSAILAASNVTKNKVILGFHRIFLSLVRTIPTLVVALIATYLLGLGTLAGTTAITIFTYAYIGKLLYEQIETVDMGAFEAMEAMGGTRLDAFVSSVMPQILPSYISNCLFCFEGNVRYAAILGYVGAGGLGLIINEKLGWREYTSVGMILVMLFITVAIIETMSHYIRKRLT
ncbi:MAG: phosphonate ABC transporter, permease protein PhnE [Lachnospiraceae bacterium]